MLIRLYQPEDAPALIALKRDTIRRISARDYSAEQVNAWAPDDSALARWPARLANRFVVVAEINRQIVGFADIAPDGHIDQFYVHAAHQRRGVGRALLNALLAQARRTNIPRLHTEASITARPFFEAHGFTVDAEQTVTARGVEFINFRMSLTLLPHTPQVY
jgi:putative acetyltransferase